MSTGSTASSLVGRVIAGKLELQKLLGQGSMGQVYRAQHTSLNKPIAIKVMRPEMNPTEEQLARFRAEAQASSRLDHPHTVQILDFGEDGEDKLLYIAMEFLEGEELSRALTRDQQFDVARACKITRQVLAALSAAHDSDIVHRDIKPGNIMLVQKKDDEGIAQEWVKVCDFGIAKLLVAEEGVPPLTMEGVSLGTPAYAAPEQILGQEIDGRADLYATGIILYTMLAGKRPFDADTPMAMAMKHIKQTAPSLTEIRPELNPKLCDLVFKAIAKKPEQRFGSAREMRDALKPFTMKQDQLQVTIPPPGMVVPTAAPDTPPLVNPETPDPERSSSADFMTMAVSTDELSETGARDDILRAFLEDEARSSPPADVSPEAASQPPAPIMNVPIVEKTSSAKIVSPDPKVSATEVSEKPEATQAAVEPNTNTKNPLMLWLGILLFVSVAVIVAVLFQWL